MVHRLRVVLAATEGTCVMPSVKDTFPAMYVGSAPTDEERDRRKAEMADVRTFAVTTEAIGPDEFTRTTQLAIRRAHCSSWQPSAIMRNTTVVNMLDGRAYRVNTPFNEFHAWAIGPAAEQDKQRSKR